MTELHLTAKHRDMLLKTIRHHLPNSDILVYGSRINGRSHDGSDLDIALRKPLGTPIPPEVMTALLEDIKDSCIPFLVDIRDWARLPASFHREIDRHHIRL